MLVWTGVNVTAADRQTVWFGVVFLLCVVLCVVGYRQQTNDAAYCCQHMDTDVGNKFYFYLKDILAFCTYSIDGQLNINSFNYLFILYLKIHMSNFTWKPVFVYSSMCG